MKRGVVSGVVLGWVRGEGGGHVGGRPSVAGGCVRLARSVLHGVRVISVGAGAGGEGSVGVGDVGYGGVTVNGEGGPGATLG